MLASQDFPGYFTPLLFIFFKPFMFTFHWTFTNKVGAPGQVKLVNESFEVTLFLSSEHFRAALLNFLEGAFQIFLKLGRSGGASLKFLLFEMLSFNHPPFVLLKSTWKRLNILLLET